MMEQGQYSQKMPSELFELTKAAMAAMLQATYGHPFGENSFGEYSTRVAREAVVIAVTVDLELKSILDKQREHNAKSK